MTADKQTDISESFLSRDTVDYQSASSTTEGDLSFRLRRPLYNNNNYQDRYLLKNTVITTRKTVVTRITSILVTIFSAVFSVFRYGYHKQSSFVGWFGKRIHQLASRVMLLDTYLLRSRSSGSSTRTSRILLLCFVPLLVFGGKSIFNY